MTPPVQALAALQDADGCFPSEAHGSGWVRADRNGFTTAMVLRALRDVPDDDPLPAVRSAALDFLERCRSGDGSGACSFWPAGLRPDWAPRLPPDLDDTAIMTVELLRYGRIHREDALRAAVLVLVPHRLAAHPGEILPAWIVTGAFKTWAGSPERPNVVDCCVNANAAALMSLAGAGHLPGYREAVETVLRGAAWAGEDPRRQKAIHPFYPSIHALFEAVEHAVECGVEPLRLALEPLARAAERSPASEACCCGAYGATTWVCPALDLARSLRREELVQSGFSDSEASQVSRAVI